MSPFLFSDGARVRRQLTSLARRFFCASCLLLFCMSTCLLSSSATGKFFIFSYLFSILYSRLYIWLELCSNATRSFLLKPPSRPFCYAITGRREKEQWRAKHSANRHTVVLFSGSLFVAQINFHNEFVFIACCFHRQLPVKRAHVTDTECPLQSWMTSVHSSTSTCYLTATLTCPFCCITVPIHCTSLCQFATCSTHF